MTHVRVSHNAAATQWLSHWEFTGKSNPAARQAAAFSFLICSYLHVEMISFSWQTYWECFRSYDVQIYSDCCWSYGLATDIFENVACLMVYRHIESVARVMGYRHIECSWVTVYRHTESVSRIMVYRHVDCDPRVMVDRRIESVARVVVYRHVDCDPRVMVDRHIESVAMTMGYRNIECFWVTTYRHIESVARVLVYRHAYCDPRVMVDRRIESVAMTMVYRRIESVFELRLTDILRVLLELWFTDVWKGLL
jgi:ribosome biogenesis protein Tsr3